MHFNESIRWVQRLKHYGKALSQLNDAVELANQRLLSRWRSRE